MFRKAYGNLCFSLKASMWATNEEEFAMLQDNTFEGAFLSTEAGVAYYNKMNRNKTVLSTVEQLFLVPFSIFFKKHSCLIASVNDQINDYTSSGLLQNWVSHFIDPRFLSKKTDQQDVIPKRLAINQLIGAFQLCILLYFLSTFIFFLEICASRIECLQYMLDFFTY